MARGRLFGVETRVIPIGLKVSFKTSHEWALRHTEHPIGVGADKEEVRRGTSWEIAIGKNHERDSAI